MSNWISGNDLIAYWEIEDFELFDFLKKGLQPYSRLGKKVVDSDSLERGRRESIEEIESNLRAGKTSGYGMFGYDFFSGIPKPLTKKRIKPNAKWIYASQSLEILNPPEDCILMSFTRPKNANEAYAASEKVKYFLFKKDEVSVFAEKHGYPRLDIAVEMPVAHKEKEESLTSLSPSVPDSPTSSKKKASVSEDNRNAFILKGDFWSVYYAGNDSNIKNIERIRYIVYLIDRPNHPFYANALRSLVKGRPFFSDDCEDSEAQPIEHAGFSNEEQGKEDFTLSDMPIENLSDEDKKALEQTMDKVWGGLTAAEKDGNEVRIKKAKQNFNDAKTHMYNEYGLKTYSSAKGPSFNWHAKLTNDAEKVRVGVTKQISNGIKHIRKTIPNLADHLERDIETGTQCIYHPDPNHPKWRVEWNN